MTTLVFMILGFVAGRFFPARHKTKNERVQLFCTLLLIFSMAPVWGSGTVSFPNFWAWVSGVFYSF